MTDITTSKKNECNWRPIGPQGRNDPSYRYRMPALQIENRGRGNGVHTVLLNLDKVSLALHIEMRYLLKYLVYELGAAEKKNSKDKRAPTLNGTFTQKQLHDLIDQFVDLFVLCPGRCRQPEIRWKFTAKTSSLSAACNACGDETPFSATARAHRLYDFVLKNPPLANKKKQHAPMSADDGHGITDVATDEQEEEDKSRGDVGRDGNGGDADDDVEWFSDTSVEAQRQRALEELDHDAAGNSDATIKKLLTSVLSCQRQQWVAALEQHTSAIKQALDPFASDQKAKIKLLHQVGEVYCAIATDKRISAIEVLHTLYERDLVDEHAIRAWYNNKEDGKHCQFHAKAAAFIKWLDEAEEE